MFGQNVKEIHVLKGSYPTQIDAIVQLEFLAQTFKGSYNEGLKLANEILSAMHQVDDNIQGFATVEFGLKSRMKQAAEMVLTKALGDIDETLASDYVSSYITNYEFQSPHI